MRHAAVLLLAALFLSGCVGGMSGGAFEHGSAGHSTTIADTTSVADIDQDGVPDLRDECTSTPVGLEVDAFGCPVPLYVHVIVPHGTESPVDEAGFAGQLARMADLMRDNPSVTLLIEGHTPPSGSQEADSALSLHWANSIRDALATRHDIALSRINAQGMGAVRPMVSNATSEGRRRNQRVELTLSGHYAALEQRPGSALAATQQTPLPEIRQASESRLQPQEPQNPVLAKFAGPQQLHFDYGGTDLVSQDLDALQRIGSFLQEHPQARISLVGHTDAKGSEDFNLGLSRRRALQVRDMLVARYSVAPSRIETEGKGESAPIADNDTEAGRLANRRVTVTLLNPEIIEDARTASTATPAPSAVKEREMPRTMGSEASAPIELKPDANYRIEVSMKQCKLWLFELEDDGGQQLVRTYTVATPRPGLRGPEGLGTITRIDFNPWWVPTANLKRAALRKGKRLPDRVRPSSPANPMGKFKIHLSHGTALRIHGTNQPGLIGQRVSAGCIRMQNDQGLELARAVNVGTEVMVVD